MLLNYSTKKDPQDTIAEIQKMLTKHGVNAMMTEYEGPQVSAVSFRINFKGNPRAFKLPCNWRGVLAVLKESKIPSSLKTDEQAVRVAWRIVKDWVEAQLALVEVNMVTIPQVFLPYMQVGKDQTLYEKIDTDPNFLLGDGS